MERVVHPRLVLKLSGRPYSRVKRVPAFPVECARNQRPWILPLLHIVHYRALPPTAGPIGIQLGFVIHLIPPSAFHLIRNRCPLRRNPGRVLIRERLAGCPFQDGGLVPSGRHVDRHAGTLFAAALHGDRSRTRLAPRHLARVAWPCESMNSRYSAEDPHKQSRDSHSARIHQQEYVYFLFAPTAVLESLHA